MIVSATQIKITGLIGFVRFVIHVKRIRSQLERADGLLFVKFNGLRTLTGWRDPDAMKAFRNNGQHLEAMRNIKKMGASKSISWVSPSEPDWSEAAERLHDVPFSPHRAQ